MNQVTQSLIDHGGVVLFTVVLVEQVGLPLPSALWLLAAGALSASGEMNAVFAIGVSVAACLIADSLWFYVGRRGANRVLRVLCRWSPAPNSSVGRTKSLFVRHGPRGLVVAKFLPGLGTVMPPLVGALGVSGAHFLLFDSLGSFLYGAFYVFAGFFFHTQLQQLLAALKQLGFSALLSAMVLLSACVVVKCVRRRTLLVEQRRHKITEFPEAGMFMI
jgi:membrane protein DedA with SNARE-associated domain